MVKMIEVVIASRLFISVEPRASVTDASTDDDCDECCQCHHAQATEQATEEERKAKSTQPGKNHHENADDLVGGFRMTHGSAGDVRSRQTISICDLKFYSVPFVLGIPSTRGSI